MNKITIPCKYLDRIFAQPKQWGHRGDPMLWDWLKSKLKSASWALTGEQLLRETRKHLDGFGVDLSGRCDESRNDVRIKAFDRGGMSGVCVSTQWWLTTGLPLIEQRLTEVSHVLAVKQLKLPRNVQDLLFIGDIHAQYDKLIALLEHCDYIESAPDIAFTEGRLVFLGDLIDNKPELGGDHLSLLNYIKGLVDKKLAHCVLGNHEFNAIGWSLRKPDGSYCRDRIKPGNRRQHQLFLEQVGEDSRQYHQWIEWFKTLPLFIDFADVRVIHACWHQESIDNIRRYLNDDNSLKSEHWYDAFDPRHELYQLCETLLKGPEMALPKGYSFKDKNGIKRDKIRVGWWKDQEEIKTFRDLTVEANAEGDRLPDLPVQSIHTEFNQAQAITVPVVVGHYTLKSASPYCVSDEVVCVDFDAASAEQPLVGYRVDLKSWQNIDDLVSEENFCSVDQVSTDIVIEMGINGILDSFIESIPAPEYEISDELSDKITEVLMYEWAPVDSVSQNDYAYYIDDVLKLAGGQKEDELAVFLYFTEKHILKIERKPAKSLCRRVACHIISMVKHESEQVAHSPTYDKALLTPFISKAKGALLGLALGDALGTTLEFKTKDSYQPLTDIVGGGPFRLKAGQWTDDTSMALCLADSLLAVGRHNAEDQMQRYKRWRDLGENSVTGKCFDIGNTVSAAIDKYVATKDANAGSQEAFTAGNGSLMRFAPVAIFYSPVKKVELSELLDKARLASIVTHAEQRAIEGCQIMAWLMYRIFNGEASKESLFKGLSGAFTDLNIDLSADMEKIVAGSFLTKNRRQIRGTGFVVDSLEAALWCFANSESFEQGALLAANLGDDADTTAAIFGQLAGAFYGIEQLPEHWLRKLAWREKIEQTAEFLALTPPLSQLTELITDIQDKTDNGRAALHISDKLFKDFFRFNMILNYAALATERSDPSADIQRFDYLESLRYITALIRGEKFNPGGISNTERSGDIDLWARRLIEWYAFQPNEQYGYDPESND